MTDSQIYSHPKPQLNRMVHYGALIITGLMVISAPFQILLTMLGAPGGLFILSAIVTILLSTPVLMLTAYAPTIIVEREGLILQPIIWKEQLVTWEEIKSIKIYPLLPSEDTETTRKIVVGRIKYRAAEGILLVIPKLPLQYRIAGFYAGEHAAPIIAITNRAHTNYDELVKIILSNTSETIHDESLYA